MARLNLGARKARLRQVQGREGAHMPGTLVPQLGSGTETRRSLAAAGQMAAPGPISKQLSVGSQAVARSNLEQAIGSKILPVEAFHRQTCLPGLLAKMARQE